ncbi:cysteine desulfurase family protein [Flavicella sediminum]|uniref:cysteine desulfurase family protein n=1 Tax=Flavicella sediminum TaxID=2585141 RepID=UPI001121A10B|nr:cysteine desulfurase family protein [Flavicella sediminum]
MRKVYLDNAATTPMYDEVIAEMTNSMKTMYGNPSSTHQFGRTAKSAIENARKTIANLLKVSASEIIFTSGGSEADNLILNNAVVNLGVTQIITSKIEHHAVLKTVNELHLLHKVKISFVDIDEKGTVDLVHLRSLLADENHKSLVSLMFVNNEIGNILDVKKVATICKEYKAFFHSDAVQAIGHLPVDLEELAVDFVAASAHKFHGPKGVGFAYFKKGMGVKPMLFGGEQEKGARAGTEAVHSILGMEKALKMSLENLTEDSLYLENLKSDFLVNLQKEIPSVKFNGLSGDVSKSTSTIVNVQLPKEYAFLLFHLDMKGIAVSGGSACQSGSNKGSHVLNTILSETEAIHTSLRFSFSKFTKQEDLQYVIAALKEKVLIN